MRRADRLFEILQLLRGGRLRTARDLADSLEVSTRTIWRDIADLQKQNVPIDGARGVGYMLRDGYFLPPLALTPVEMEALVWGTRLVETYGDAALADAARELQIKISAVSGARDPGTFGGMAAFPPAAIQTARDWLGAIRMAIGGRRKLVIGYTDLNDKHTVRTVRPLNLEFWGRIWTLTVWCEMRADFRVFRCDRIETLEVLSDVFRDEPGKRFSDYVSSMKKDGDDDTP